MDQACSFIFKDLFSPPFSPPKGGVENKIDLCHLIALQALRCNTSNMDEEIIFLKTNGSK